MIPSDLIANIALKVFNSLWEAKHEAYTLISQKLRQAIFFASEEYEDNYITRHGFIKQEEFGYPLFLNDVFISPVFLDRRETDLHLDQVSDRLTQIDTLCRLGYTCDGFDLINQYPFLIIKGEASIGKSTFLKKIGLEALSGALDKAVKHECIPVLLQLSRQTEAGFTFKDLIEREFAICGFPEYKEFTESALRKGRLLILIDRLDYMPLEHQRNILIKLREFSDTYSSNRYILACRRTKDTRLLQRFHEAFLLGFGSQQIQKYVNQLRINQIKQKSQVIGYDQTDLFYGLTDTRSFARDALHNPFNLNIAFCLYSSFEMRFFKQTILYEKILRHLIEISNFSANMDLQSGRSQEIINQKLERILEFAYFCLKAQKDTFNKVELLQHYDQDSREAIADHPLIGLDPLNRWETFELIKEINHETFNFINPLIQKLLAAHHLVANPDIIEPTLKLHFYKPDWKDVFIFTAGLQDASSLLMKIQKRTGACIAESQTSQVVLDWASQASSRVRLSPNLVINRSYTVYMFFETVLFFGINKNNQFLIANILREIREIISLIEPRLQAIRNFNPRSMSGLRLSTNYPIDPKMLRSLNLDRLLDIGLAQISKTEQCNLLSQNDSKLIRLTILKLKSNVKDKKISLYHRKVCEENLYRIWLNGLGLNPNSIQLSMTELKQIQQYCQGIRLLLSCLKEASFVSPGIRDDMINSVFMNPQRLQ